MPRAKNRVASRERRKKVLDQAKGFYGRRKSNLKLAKEAVQRAGQYAYEHRKDKKGDFRKLWITRINAAVRAEGMTYSDFICGLKRANVELDRKVMSDMAIHNQESFKSLVETARSQLRRLKNRLIFLSTTIFILCPLCFAFYIKANSI